MISYNMIVEDEWHTYDNNFNYSYDYLDHDMPINEVSNYPCSNLKNIYKTHCR